MKTAFNPQLDYQQDTMEKSGVSCLIAVLKAQGKLPLQKETKIEYKNKFATLQPKTNPHQPDADYERVIIDQIYDLIKIEEMRNYTFPHGLTAVANQLGLQAQSYMLPGTKIPRPYTATYKIGELGEVHEYVPPAPNELHMYAVHAIEKLETSTQPAITRKFHWIVAGEEGRYYDPAQNPTAPSPEVGNIIPKAPVPGACMGREAYSATGIWLSLS